jgi:hypothetical protein
LIAYLAEPPTAGVLIQGTGGTAFGKNEKVNLSGEEKQLLAKAVKELVVFWRPNNGQGIH